MSGRFSAKGAQDEAPDRAFGKGVMSSQEDHRQRAQRYLAMAPCHQNCH
jgi:hypothetical protein